MVLLRYGYILALTLWLGGMVTLGAISAPATFAVLQAESPTQGRAQAGAVFGETLKRFQWITYGCGIVMLVFLGTIAILGPRPPNFAVRMTIVAAMLGISLYSGVWVTGEIERLQTEIGAPVSSLPDGDPRRGRFGRLHGLSTVLMMLNVGGCLVLLSWEALE
jgi:uncharacterized membrane protein